MALSYSDAGQVLAAMFTIMAWGFFLIKVKMFKISELWDLQYLVDVVLMPGLLFQIIGSNKLNMDTWKSFFPIAILQFVVHLITWIFLYFMKSSDKLKTYIKYATTYAYQEYTAYLYQFVQHTVGKSYTTLCVHYLIMDSFIYKPILKIILFYLNKQIEELNESSDQKDTKPLKKGRRLSEMISKAAEAEAADAAEDGNELENIDHDGNPKPDLHEDSESKPANKEKLDDEEEEDKQEPPSLTKTLVFAWVNSTTICTILGFIWSAIDIDMIDFLSDFSGDFEKASCGAVMFIAGAIVAENLSYFKVWSPQIIISLVYRYIIMPLIAGGLCQAFKISAYATKMCVLMACSPISLNSARIMNQYDDMDEQKAIFNWTVVAYIPVQFCWLAIIIETNLFC